MSITTKRGDAGTTDLLFGKKTAKTSLRIAALGDIDELNAALGMARVQGINAEWVARIDRVQGNLVSLMGMVATLPEDQERYRTQGFSGITGQDVEWLEAQSIELENAGVTYDGWARPGSEGCLARAQLDFARAVSRRAERSVLALHESSEPVAEVVRLFFNRLSDMLWMMARSGIKPDGE